MYETVPDNEPTFQEQPTAVSGGSGEDQYEIPDFPLFTSSHEPLTAATNTTPEPLYD